MICDRCGRLLNRATGRCPVCADAPDAPPPPPVAVTHPPPDAPRPISAAAALAVLSPADRVNAKPVGTPRPQPAAMASEPSPAPPTAPGAPLGIVRRVRIGRRLLDLAVYEGAAVLARRSRTDMSGLTVGQAAAAHPENRMIAAAEVDDIAVREDGLSGRARIRLRKGERLALSWWGRGNRGLAVENLLSHAFPGTVDQAPPQIPLRVAKAVAAVAGALAVFFVVMKAVAVLTPDPAPPPPPPAAAPVTLPPAEEAARTALAPACSTWRTFAPTVPVGERPAPAALRPVADAARGGFDAAAAASADYAPARDELAYLQAYAKRPAPEAAKESLARVRYAMDAVSAACARAAG